jgi:hypothetical protein
VKFAVMGAGDLGSRYSGLLVNAGLDESPEYAPDERPNGLQANWEESHS